jgi:sulfide:quinone oxidoreductase
MVPVALSDTIAVGEVPTAAEIEILAKAGFRSLLNTQPEGEVERHLTSAQAEFAAKGSGLAYRHLPVESRRPSEATVSAFAQALTFLPKPIYACCYSGARTAAAWALAAAPHMETERIASACLAAGYDIDFLRPAIEERRKRVASEAAGETSAAAAAGDGAAAPPANGLAHANGTGSAAGGGNGAAQTVASEPPPALQPTILPRAGSAGGFAVSG